MPTTYLHGQALRLYTVDTTDAPALADVAEGNAFACAKSASLTTNNNVIDVTCLGNTTGSGAGYRGVAPGQISWSVSTELLAVMHDTEKDITDIEALYSAGTEVYIILGPTDTNTFWYGKAFITSLDLQASNGEVATFSVSLEGNGELSHGTLV